MQTHKIIKTNCKLEDRSYQAYRCSNPLILSRQDVQALNKCILKQTDKAKNKKGEVVDLCSFQQRPNLDLSISFERKSNIFINKQQNQSVYRSKRFLSTIIGYSFREEACKLEGQTTINDRSLQQIEDKNEIDHYPEISRKKQIEPSKINSKPVNNMQTTPKVKEQFNESNKQTKNGSVNCKNAVLSNQIENNLLKEVNFLSLLGIKKKLKYSTVKISNMCVLLKLNLMKGAVFECELTNESVSYIQIIEASNHKKPIELKNIGEQMIEKGSKVLTIRRGQGFILRNKAIFGLTVCIKVQIQ